MKKFLNSIEGRKYLYNIAISVLSLCTVAFGLNAAMTGSIESLIAAVLNLGGAATNALARKNVR